MYEKRSTRDEILREGAKKKGHLEFIDFNEIDKALKTLPEKEEQFIDQLIADLIQTIIQDTTSIENAVRKDYGEYFDKNIRNSTDPVGEDEKLTKELSEKYVMPEEVIDAIINNS